MKRKITVFALILCLIAMLLPSTAFAKSETAVDATLTIIKGVDDWTGEPVVMVNKEYRFEGDATLKDLFQAAVDAGDLDAFEFDYGYIKSITGPGESPIVNDFGDLYTYYWANYKNGVYAQGNTDCTETDALTDGVCFQFSYEAYPKNVTPNADQWAALLEDSDTTDTVAGEGEGEPAGTATVLILRGSTGENQSEPSALVNTEVEFYEGATVGDAFDAIVEDGYYLDAYEFNDYGLQSVTWLTYELTQPADYSSYWASYKNEVYASGTECTKGDVLEDGARYAYVWTDYPNKIGLTEDAWTALSAKAETNWNLATLTIIKGVDDWTGAPVVIVNKKYPFEDGATLKDLFQAAVDAGDLDAFEFDYGYIKSITGPGESPIVNDFGDLYTYYWANYKNGVYAQGNTDCTETDLLTNGVCFQFSYEAYPKNVTPNADQWAALLEDSDTTDTVAGEGEGEPAGTATVLILRGSTGENQDQPSALVNTEVEFYEGATVGDAFDAIVEDGYYLDDYEFGDYGLKSVTWLSYELTQPDDYSSYWASYKNEVYASGTECTKGDVLEDGARYAYVWTDYPNKIGLTEDAWTALSALAEEGIDPALEPIVPSPADGTVEVSKDASFNKDFSELYESFIEKGMNDSSWMAMSAIAAGESQAGDVAAAKEAGAAAYESPGPTNIQKSIIVLTAMGVDVTAVEFESGNPVNMLEKLASAPSAIGSWAESPAYTLLAFGANPSYGVPQSELNNPDKVIETLKSYQCEDGAFGWGGNGSPDTVGAVLAGLSCYMDNEEAATMAANAIEALKSYQNEDGGFGYAKDSDTNVDSTALAIIGLCSMGVDPTGEEWTKGENNPITALLSFANEDNSDLTEIAGLNMQMCREDAFRAMAAFAGLRKTGAAYNVYTQAAKGQAQFDVAYLDQEDLTLPVEDTTQLNFVIRPESDATVTWESSDPAVASVDETGKVTAEHTGKATITVTAGDYSATCEVRVIFKDVTEPNKYWYDPVYWAEENGITNGYQSASYKGTAKFGTFGPEENCTREQMITFLWRQAGTPEPTITKSPFTDVKSGYYLKAVLWAYEKGITKGYSSGPNKGKFGVGLTVTREDTVTFIYRMAGKPSVSEADRNKYTFTDLTKGKYYADPIVWAAKNGITKGYSSGPHKGKFGVGFNVLRKDIVTFLYRYDNLD